jgi:hypothetical protein
VHLEHVGAEDCPDRRTSFSVLNRHESDFVRMWLKNLNILIIVTPDGRLHLRLFETFRNNKKDFYGEGLSAPSPTPQAGGPPLVGCPRLLIQYICSYPPYPEDFPPSAT